MDNGREADVREKLEAFETLKAAGDPTALFEWAGLAEVALEFRATDAMIGLPTVDDELVAQLSAGRLEALRLAGEAGHEGACLAFAQAAWAASDATLAPTAVALAKRSSTQAESLYLLGLFAFNGFGVKKDAAASLGLHHEAAAKGHGAAMFELYAMLSQGLGATRNEKEAFAWCEKSAAAGYARAMANLGAFYATGNGVRKDQALSVKWYDAAARAGHGRSAAILGVMHALGQGAPQSVDKAKEYFVLADENGFEWRGLADAQGLDPDEYEA
jgi:TPR repeat protein